MTFAFLEILAKYPANTDAKAILDKCVAMERKDYTDAVASQSVASLDAFMKKYPDSAFREDVADRIDDLPLWLKAKGQNTIDSYKRYLAESGHRIYKQEADDAIADLSTSQAYFNALRVNTIDALKHSGHPCKTLVGGAVLTPEYATEIGADYYAKDAKQSADIAKEVLG